MKVFGGSASKSLTEKIAKHLSLEASFLDVFVFPDKEKRIRVREKVLDDDCIIIQSTNTPPDENYMELFLSIDCLKRSGAKSVKAFVPYLGYQRQDHIFRDGEAVSAEVIAGILDKSGLLEIYSFDLHTPKIIDMFNIPVHHLSALPVFSRKIKKDFNLGDLVLVSPDMGGIRRIKELSELLGNIPFATVLKNRNLNSGKIQDGQLDGDVRGKIALIVDDIIATGITIADTSNLLINSGVSKVFAFATHAVFAGRASEILQKSPLERVFVSDTIEIPDDKQFPKLEILSISEIAAEALKS